MHAHALCVPAAHRITAQQNALIDQLDETHELMNPTQNGAEANTKRISANAPSPCTVCAPSSSCVPFGQDDSCTRTRAHQTAQPQHEQMRMRKLKAQELQAG
jgi:hypothetical protein